MFVILILALVSYCFASFQAFASSVRYTIRMTNKGFEPVILVVDKNSTIEFVNNDIVDRWPASNVHPQHEIYPEFDPKKSIRPREGWKFRASEMGEWKYHDHLFPHKLGVIKVVEESIGNREEFLESFKEKMTKFIYRVKTLFASKVKTQIEVNKEVFIKMSQKEQFKALENIAQTKGGNNLWQYLVTTFKGQEGKGGNVHDLAHFTGSLLFTTNGFAGLGICTPEFAFGCYHGFLDKAFSKSLDKLNQAEKGCLVLGSISSGPYTSCIHGIGHGISSFYQVNDLTSSLIACERLSIKEGKQYCYDGVFMEFSRDAPIDFFKKSDLIYPCNLIEDKYIFACARNQPTVLMNRFKLRFEEVIDLCLKTTNLDFKAACFDALGFIIASRSLGKPDAIVNDCSKIKVALYNARCIKSAAGELIFQNITGWQDSAPKLCDSLGGDFKKLCHDYLQKLILDYGRTK